MSTPAIEHPELGFRGTIRGVTYTDPADFVAAAKGYGWVGYDANGGDKWKWRRGVPVTVRMHDTREVVSGSVWSPADVPGFVWVALETGKFVAVTNSGYVYETTSRRGLALGQAVQPS